NTFSLHDLLRTFTRLCLCFFPFLQYLNPIQSLNFYFFFYILSTTAEIYTLSLHDALPIWRVHSPLPTRLCLRSRLPRSSLWSGKDRKSTRLNSSHGSISYAVFCLKKKKQSKETQKTPKNQHILRHQKSPWQYNQCR